MDGRLRSENEKLRKQLSAAQDNTVYLERLLERMQTAQHEVNEESRDLRRKVKKLEYILYGKKHQH